MSSVEIARKVCLFLNGGVSDKDDETVVVVTGKVGDPIAIRMTETDGRWGWETSRPLATPPPLAEYAAVIAIAKQSELVGATKRRCRVTDCAVPVIIGFVVCHGHYTMASKETKDLIAGGQGAMPVELEAKMMTDIAAAIIKKAEVDVRRTAAEAKVAAAVAELDAIKVELLCE